VNLDQRIVILSTLGEIGQSLEGRVTTSPQKDPTLRLIQRQSLVKSQKRLRPKRRPQQAKIAHKRIVITRLRQAKEEIEIQEGIAQCPKQEQGIWDSKSSTPPDRPFPGKHEGKSLASNLPDTEHHYRERRGKDDQEMRGDKP
jgi:hypothetical protein